MHSYSSFYIIFKNQTNRLQTNGIYINLSYLLALQVCTDRIRIITFKLIGMNFIEF